MPWLRSLSPEGPAVQWEVYDFEKMRWSHDACTVLFTSTGQAAFPGLGTGHSVSNSRLKRPDCDCSYGELRPPTSGRLDSTRGPQREYQCGGIRVAVPPPPKAPSWGHLHVVWVLGLAVQASQPTTTRKDPPQLGLGGGERFWQSQP
jgi:hypothetical protein